MLICISDLHFEDGTGGEHNVSFQAFEGAFEDIKKYGREPEEVRIAFLGDIFDINRSTYWLEVDESERPWGDMENNKDRIETHANMIMDEIISKNKPTFELLKGSLKERFGSTREPERFYVPGNHDRLCNVFDSLRIKVRNNLGIPGGPEPFPHVYDDKVFGNKYGVFARHGHEYDTWNYEGTDHFSDSDYAQIPIGDLITTEIAARLPYTIMRHVGNSISLKERESLKRNLEQIENVRPYTAIFNWLFYQVRENPHLKKEIEESLKEIIKNFNDLKYLQRWYKRHDKWNPFAYDEADKLQTALRAFKTLGIDFVKPLMKTYAKIFGSVDALSMDNSDKVLIDKAKDFLEHNSDYRYYVAGHTHTPRQIPIRISSQGLEQMYFNTGTWRGRYVQGLSNGFISWKNQTYTIFYSREENEKQFYETWTGTLKEV